MFDIPLRPLKDTLFNPLVPLIPSSITPIHLTITAFIAGLLSCYVTTLAPQSSAINIRHAALALWAFNRILDCLDGALARHRNTTSDLGGFLDLLGDFIVYSAIPIACGIAAEGGTVARQDSRGLWLSIAVLEATFHVNNFVLFFVGAVVEKRKAAAAVAALSAFQSSNAPKSASAPKVDVGAEQAAAAVNEDRGVKELTSIAMRPALIEGAESGVIFTVMLAFPQYTAGLSWAMAAAVAFGICQRTWWVWKVLS